MASHNVMGQLENLRRQLGALPGVKTCKIGMEANISPDDYPIVRLVPSDLKPHGTIGYRLDCEALIYFGQPIQPFDDTPDDGGRVRLEKLYAALFDMDDAIRGVVYDHGGQCFETVLDEDRLDTYKLMALRVRLVG